MNLKELFQEHLTQEFPPSVVFAYYKGEVKSLLVNKLTEYDLQYQLYNFYEEKSDYCSKTFSLPVLELK